MKNTARRSALGFTLIELMVVVAIIAVLAGVAFPSYQSYMRRSNRADAQQLMLNIANREQQYIIDARQYTSTIGAGGLNIASQGWTCAATCTNSFYTVQVTADNTAAPPNFAIQANPAGSQTPDGQLKLDSVGTKQRLVNGVDQGW